MEKKKLSDVSKIYSDNGESITAWFSISGTPAETSTMLTKLQLEFEKYDGVKHLIIDGGNCGIVTTAMRANGESGKEDSKMINTMIQAIEDDIIDAFKSKLRIGTEPKYRHVFIDSGAANDEITDYILQIFETSNKRERTVSFRTSGCFFPVEIRLSDYESVDTEEYNGCLFVHVQ